MGEMEVWALEAHRAAYTLQEILTIKSDDVSGRAKAFEAIIKSVDIPTPKVPESFKVLIRELQSLSLNIVPMQAVIEEEKGVVEVEEVREKAQELQEQLEGVEVVSESEAIQSLGKEEIPTETK